MTADKEIETIDSTGLKRELKNLGINTYFIEQKHVRNLYMAKRIVEGYNFGRELTQKEKIVLIQAILDNASLNEELTYYLSTLITNLQQIGLDEQETYGTIINLGVNGVVLEQSGYGYDSLLKNKNNSCQTIIQYKDRIEKRVSSMTILTALSNNLDEQEQQGLQEELERLGISRDFIKQRSVRNLYMAKKIVEGYDFGRELTKQEKRALIQAILDNSRLDEKGHKYKYISTLMQRLQQIGLDEQEIYGTIINLGVNKAVLEEAGYGYTELLSNTNNSRQTIIQYKDKIEKRVSSITMLSALSNNLNEQEKQELQEELERLGISRDFIEQRSVSNLYMAKKIVEGYHFGRELTKEEKRALIQAILNYSRLDQKKYKYIHISTLMKRFQKMGLEEQQIYGAIINLGVNRVVLDQTGYGYNSLLENKNNACQTIAKYKGEIRTEVTKKTIKKALRKAEKVMKMAVKSQKDKRTISDQAATRAQLGSLVTGEMSQEMYNVQIPR